MDRIQILVVGRSKEIVSELQRIIDQNEAWQSSAAYDDEGAILLFQQMQYDIVLLSIDVEEASKTKLRNIFRFQQPELIIIQQNVDNYELLEREIRETLDKRAAEQKARFNFFNGLLN